MPTPGVYNRLVLQMRELVKKWRAEADEIQGPRHIALYNCSDDLAEICGEDEMETVND